MPATSVRATMEPLALDVVPPDNRTSKGVVMSDLQKFKDALAGIAAKVDAEVTGRPEVDYQTLRAEGKCVSCREPAIAKCYSPAGRKEYAISGMCEPCFDNLFKETD